METQMSDQAGNHHAHHHDEGSDHKPPKDQVILEVGTPNGVFRGSFEKTAKIEDVIAAIVRDRQLAAGDSFELFYGETALTPVQRTLVSFGLTGTVKLTLVATGSGV
jgi:hypothetical protein